MPSLTVDMAHQGFDVDHLLIDRGYINSTLVDEVLARRGTIVCKPFKPFGVLVEDGEEVVIERHRRPVAQLVPVRTRRRPSLGAMRGQFEMVEGWERPLSDEEAEAFWSGR
jgi:antitoxin (DNA-binding transcriptional repressor) of toxin-antitoxin stability system